MKRRIATVVLALVLVALAGWIIFRRATQPPAGTTQSELSWLVDRARDREQFSGTILVARRGVVVFSRSVGPMDRDTPIPIASVSKPITAVLVLQLIEARQLALEDRLTRFFPTLQGTAAGNITIQQLLTHTSGIEEVISRNPRRRITADDLRTAVVKPGGFEYSNTGYVCLAMVIEAVTHVPYATAMQSRVFDAAEMRDSGVLRSAGGIRASTDIGAAPEALDGAGSIYSTALDLVRFDRALASGKLLSSPMRYGWMPGEQSGRPYAWHSGDMPGYSSYLARVPARDEVVIILANANVDVRALARKMLRVLKQHPRT